jgi:hypothetical protein
MDIITALTTHHQEMRNLFAAAMTNPAAAEDAIRHLVIHHTNEEKFFYDHLENITQMRHDALEAVNEHHIIELIIQDLRGFPKDHERYLVKIESLKEYTEHHLLEEEEEIFVEAAEVLDYNTRLELGARFNEIKSRQLGCLA